MDNKLIVGYCRVSSKQQFTDGHALERYIDALILYGIPQNLIFFDIESGVSDTRKGLNDVLDLVRSNRVAQVVIPNFDRLTRSPLQWEQARELLVKHNVKIQFLEDGNLDLLSPDGLFTGRIKAALAAQVRDRLRSHSIAGHAKHRERKEPYKPVFGYIKIDGELKPNTALYPESKSTYFEVARLLVELFLQYKSIGKAQEEFRKQHYIHSPSYFGKIHLKAPSSGTGFKSWITNAVLRGKLQYLSFGHKTPQIIIEGEHQALISELEWIAIKSILDDNKTIKKGTNSDKLSNVLSGLARCKNCSGMMTQRLNYKNKAGEWSRFLVCRNARDRNNKCNSEYAKTYGLTLEIAEDKIKSALMAQAENVADLLCGIESISPKINSPEIESIIKSIEKLEFLNDPDLEEIIEKKKTQLFLLQESEKLKKTESIERVKLYQYIKQPKFWDTMTVYERNLLFRDLIDVVWCDRGVVEVVFTP